MMNQNKPVHKNFGILLAVLGIAMTFGGAQIINLGGSFYFLVVGLLILCSGILINRGLKLGAFVFLFTFAVMLIWSIQEVGFDVGKLFTRLGMAVILLIYIFASKVFKSLK